MRPTAHAGGLLVLLLSGCSVPLMDRGTELENTCAADDECGTNGVCRNDRCVSTKAQLDGLLLQVALPTQAPYGAGTSFLVDPAEDGISLQGHREDGYWIGYDLRLSELVDITNVRLVVDPPPAGCAPANGDGSLPVAVQIHPAEQLVGLPLTVYAASSALVYDGSEASYQCSLKVPAGTYDIYVTVDRDPADEQDPNQHCDLPPVLLTDHELTSANVSIDVSVAQPSTLTGTISGLNDTLHLTGWTLELVENRNGRPISTSQVFEQRSGLNPSGDFAISYWPELAEQAIIRLSPPDGTEAMPTVLWLLDAVDLDGDHHVGLDLTALGTAKPVLIDGSVLDGDTSSGVGATVTIQSQELLGGEFGANAAYRTTANAGGSGRFEVPLLPGTYKVIAQPGGNPNRAVTQATWMISPNDLGGGKTILLRSKTSMVGTVLTASGEPAFDVPAYLQPSATAALPYLEDVLSTYDVLPTNATGLTDPQGAFAIQVDPGAFDLSIRPGDGSGYPWLVRARVTIQPSDDPVVADLGTLTVSNPVVLSGRLLSPQGAALAGASIRAWIPVHDATSADAQSTVIQIAESLSDATGAYTLFLPASISQ